MATPNDASRLREFFHAMARRTFTELGVGDDAVVGYVAALLTDFSRADRLYALRIPGGTSANMAQIAAAAAETPRDERALLRTHALRKYVADYALFMSGLFRTHVEQHGALDYYFQEGQRAYWDVSELDLARYRTGFLLFQQLSRNFEHYSGALDYMRKAYFAPQPGTESPFALFLREVEGWITTGMSSN
ncbi:MAG TPA: hypothetical protein VGK30_16820 [Candidatus Binatia bacterium]|jgi:hypothetical protein